MDLQTFLTTNAGRAAIAQYETEISEHRRRLIDEKVAARGERA